MDIKATLQEILGKLVAFIDDVINKYITGIEIDIDIFNK